METHTNKSNQAHLDFDFFFIFFFSVPIFFLLFSQFCTHHHLPSGKKDSSSFNAPKASSPSTKKRDDLGECCSHTHTQKKKLSLTFLPPSLSFLLMPLTFIFNNDCPDQYFGAPPQPFLRSVDVSNTVEGVGVKDEGMEEEEECIGRSFSEREGGGRRRCGEGAILLLLLLHSREDW